VAELQDISGLTRKLDSKKIKKEVILNQSMMHSGLTSNLTVKQFTDLISYLQSMK
jgi:hypothetical protein